MEHIVGTLRQHSHASDYACPWRRGCSQRPSSWRRYYCRHLGASRKRYSYGHVLLRAPYGVRCSSTPLASIVCINLSCTRPLLGPTIGGAIALKWNWRGPLWFLSIYGLVVLVFLIFALPETLEIQKSFAEEAEENIVEHSQQPSLSRVSSRQIVHQKSKKWGKVLKRIFIDPLSIILYLRFPAVAITVYYASITFGALYVLNISLQTTFAKPPYNFSTLEVGFTYIPNSVGYLLASLFGGKWADKIMAREARKVNRYDKNGRLVYLPEDRMRENTWVAAFLYPAALIWYGWTAEKGTLWVVPVSSRALLKL